MDASGGVFVVAGALLVETAGGLLVDIGGVVSSLGWHPVNITRVQATITQRVIVFMQFLISLNG